ncbi:MAG: nucleotidyltransferase family protein [Byssovorax sp.]
MDEIRALVTLPLDWDFLCRSADKHRVTQLLFRNLSAICPEALPADIKARLRHQFHTNAGANLKLARALITLYRAFGAQDIPVIPFKGSVLAIGTYGKLALRQSYDVDLLVRAQDIARSHRLLVEEGYCRDEVFDREARYQHSETGVEVDLHWGFAPRYFHLAVDFEDLISRTRVVSLMDQSLITFSPEDFLEILCLQVMKDCWERRQQLEHLSKVCDIAEHLRAHPDLAWGRIYQSLRNKGLIRIFETAMALTDGLLQVELSPEVRRRIGSGVTTLNRARWVCRSLFTENDTLSPLENSYLSARLRFQQLRFYLGIRERYRERIRHLGEIFRPGNTPDMADEREEVSKKERDDGSHR